MFNHLINLNQFEDFIGFENTNEFLPKGFDKFDSKEKLRQLFLYMSNIILKNVCYFNKYEQIFLSNYSLKQAFEYKIRKELKLNFVTYEKQNLKNLIFVETQLLLLIITLTKKLIHFLFQKIAN